MSTRTVATAASATHQQTVISEIMASRGVVSTKDLLSDTKQKLNNNPVKNVNELAAEFGRLEGNFRQLKKDAGSKSAINKQLDEVIDIAKGLDRKLGPHNAQVDMTFKAWVSEALKVYEEDGSKGLAAWESKTLKYTDNKFSYIEVRQDRINKINDEIEKGGLGRKLNKEAKGNISVLESIAGEMSESKMEGAASGITSLFKGDNAQDKFASEQVNSEAMKKVLQLIQKLQEGPRSEIQVTLEDAAQRGAWAFNRNVQQQSSNQQVSSSSQHTVSIVNNNNLLALAVNISTYAVQIRRVERSIEAVGASPKDDKKLEAMDAAILNIWLKADRETINNPTRKPEFDEMKAIIKEYQAATLAGKVNLYEMSRSDYQMLLNISLGKGDEILKSDWSAFRKTEISSANELEKIAFAYNISAQTLYNAIKKELEEEAYNAQTKPSKSSKLNIGDTPAIGSP